MMKRFWLLIFALMLLPAVASAAVQAKGVQLDVTADKAAYQSGETIECRLNVVNTNDQAVTVRYQVVPPEGLTLAQTQLVPVQAAVNGSASAAFSLLTQKTLPPTGDGFPLEAALALLALSAAGLGVLLRKKRLMSLLLLCVLLTGAAVPALAAYPEDAAVFAEQITEEEHMSLLEQQELQWIGTQAAEEIPSATELGRFEIHHPVVLDGQTVIIAVTGVLTCEAQPSDAPLTLPAVQLNAVTILGRTRFWLSWSAVPGATHYEVWQSAGNGFIRRATLAGTSWMTNDGAADALNIFMVRAIVRSGGETAARGPFAARSGYGLAKPLADGVHHTSDTSEDVRVRWSAEGSPTGCYVYRSLTGADGSFVLIGQSDGGSFVDRERNAYYRIRPYYTAAQNGVTYLGPASNVVAMPAQYRALVIGQTYPNGVLTALPGCRNDARAVQGMLGSTAGDAGRYRPADVTLQLDLPDAEAFLAQIQTVFQRAKAGDVSLIYYSGHGMGSDDPAQNGAWMGTAYDRTNPEALVTPGQLRAWLDQVPGQKVILSDSCHSGNLIDKYAADGVSFSAESYNRSFISAFAGGGRERGGLAASGYFVISACRGSQTSVEVGEGWYGKRGGLFTIHMLRGSGYDHAAQAMLPDWPADQDGSGGLTLHEVYTYTDAAVRQSLAQMGLSSWIHQDAQVYPENSSQLLWGR